MSQSILGHGLRYDCDIKLPDGQVIQFVEHNLLPQVGIDHVAGLIRADGTTPISGWFVGLFESDYVPTASVKATDLPGVVGECQAYSEASRPAWVNQYDGVGQIDSINSKAVFTMTADKRIYGAFIVSSAAKGGNGGVVLSIARFSSARDLPAGAEFGVAAILNLIPTDV